MVNKLKILVIDDDPSMQDVCREILVRRGYEVEVAGRGGEGLGLMSRWAYDIVLLDLRMPDIDGMEVLKRIRQQDPQAIVVVITGHGSIHSAVQAMKLGAFDFLPKPFTPEQLRSVVDKAADKRRLMLENAYLREELRHKSPSRLIYASAAMAKVMEVVRKVAPTDTTVLITGESGTGKGLVARIIHELSPRRDKPFVSVDCSALVSSLFESELFGHVKGAFTGADTDKMGKFELARGGTLFFDEVGNISWEIQAKLLKAVEERAICRVGSNRVIQVDTRLIAATNQDLRQAVARGTFRQDLFYRLHVVHIHLPPLRERPEDIPLLANYFLERFRYLSSVRVRGFTPRLMQTLQKMPWPGNVRELENTIQRLVVLAQRPYIDLPELESSSPMPPTTDSEEEALLPLAEVERRHILRTLKLVGGHKTRAAKALGIDRKTLRLKLKKYGLEEELARGS